MHEYNSFNIIDFHKTFEVTKVVNNSVILQVDKKCRFKCNMEAI